MKYISIIFLLSFISLSTNSSAQSENYNPLPVPPYVKKYDIAAKYPGGADSLLKFFKDNCQVFIGKNHSRSKDYVLVKFYINEQGDVVNAKAINGVAGQPQLVKEALRLIEIMPRWLPATLDNKAVEYEVNLSIPFFKE